MQLKGQHIEGNIQGKPLLTFSSELNRAARLDLATKIEHIDEILYAVSELLKDGHIKSILSHLKILQKVYGNYVARREARLSNGVSSKQDQPLVKRLDWCDEAIRTDTDRERVEELLIKVVGLVNSKTLSANLESSELELIDCIERESQR